MNRAYGDLSASAASRAARSRRESEPRALLRILATQSQNANPLVALAAVVMVITMYGEVDSTGLFIWSALAVIGGGSRFIISRRVKRDIADAPEQQLRGDLRLMIWGTALNSLMMGSAFWLIAAHGDMYVRMVVTLIALVQMTAVLLYLTPSVTDRLISTAGNLVQGALFWLGVGTVEPPHWELVVVYAGLFWCGMVSAREQLRQFRESLRMRDENATLLASLEEERAAVQAALEEARLANDSKSRFLAAASHDLRQPLHALTMFLGTLGFHLSDEEQRRLLRRATDTLRVLEEQFNSLLDLSRFDAGAVAPHLRPFRLDELLRKVVEEFRQQAEAKGVALHVIADSAWASSDPLLLGRLLRNLLDNAVHYTVRGQIAVALRRDGHRFEVSVQDSGPGIAPDQQARIFDEYVQLDNPARQRERGVGLGLAIVKRIDQLLGLGLHLHSALGTGSNFIIQVPLAEEQNVEPEVTPLTTDPLAFRTAARVWILDDDAVVLEGLTAQLEVWGAEVRSFTTAEDLLAALRQSESLPDWVLTDDMLGDAMSGYKLVEELARQHPAVHCCLITGNTEPARLAMLRASGAPVIVKPATQQRLIELLSLQPGEPPEVTLV